MYVYVCEWYIYIHHHTETIEKKDPMLSKAVFIY